MSTTITPLPTPPSRAVPSTFSAQADAFLSALPALASEMNVVAAEVEANAIIADGAGAYASEAAASASTATTQAGIAVAATATLAAGSISDAAYDDGAWDGVTTIAPSKNAMRDKFESILSPKVKRSPRTANTILGAGDFAKLIDITSGTFTQTFDAAATLGDGWYCYIRNSGTGDITLDPDGTELIDGLASYVMYPGEVRLIQCDGAALRSVVLQSFYKVFTATDALIKPPGYSAFAGLAWSAGASGNKGGTTARGGGGGGCFPFTIPASLLAASETITIGAGGAATTASTRNAGGNTTIGSLLTVVGANGSGNAGAIKSPISVVALAVSSVIVAVGFEATGYTGDRTAAVYGGATAHVGTSAGSSSIYGGGAGGGYNGSAQAGGTSSFAGNGGACGDSTDGVDGTAPAGGGGGTNTGTQSGAGARGEVRIWGVL